MEPCRLELEKHQRMHQKAKRTPKGTCQFSYAHRVGCIDVAVSFLLTDLELANTFLDIANSTRDEERRIRNIANARAAHDTVRRFAAKLEGPERSRIEQALANVKKRLEGLS